MVKSWWFAAALALAACSGDGTKDTSTAGDDDDDDDITGGELVCEDTFVPCGGDPVGVWQVVDYCAVSAGEYDDTCPDLTVTVLDDRGSGEVTMNADGTYTRTYNVDVDLEMVIPVDCIAPAPCALLPLSGFFTSCADDTDAGTCVCQATVVDTDTASGSWVVDGTDVITDGERNAFCVEGSTALVEDSLGNRVRWMK